MSAGHTPGPWVINTAGSAKAGEAFKIDEIYVYAPATQDDTAICGDVIDPVTQEPSEANARLIATAPELLKVLQELQESASYWGEYDVPCGIVDRINAAIAKATGETP